MAGQYDLGTISGVIRIGYKPDGIPRAGEDLDKVKGKARSTGQAFDKVGTATTRAGLLIAGGLLLAARSAGNFEQRISAIKAVSGGTAAQIDLVRAKALQLGKDTKFSASESAEAIEELVKAGISLPDVLNGAADATVALAAAGEIDLPQAAKIASNAMNQFGLTAKELPRVADLIAGAANASAIDVHEFGFSLSQVGAVAHLAGLSFRDTAVAIAEMGNAGIKGSDAGTSLKTFLSNLIPVTEKQIQLFEDLGLAQFNLAKATNFLSSTGIKPVTNDLGGVTTALQKFAAEQAHAPVGSEKAIKAYQELTRRTGLMKNQFFDATGKTKDLSQIQGILSKSLAGMSKEQKLATLETLFGSDAIRAAAVFAENGSAGFDKLAASMGKVTAADVAKTRMDNFNGSLEQFKGSVETAGIQIGTVLLPALRGLVDGLNALLGDFLSLPKGMQKTITELLLVAAGALLFVGALIKVTRGIQSMVATFKVLGEFAKANPFLLILAGAILLALILVELYRHSEKFRKSVTAVMNFLKKAVTAVGSAFQVTGRAISSAFSSTLEFFTKLGNVIGRLVVGAVRTLGNVFDNDVMPVLRAFGRVFSAIANALAPAIVGAVRLISDVFRVEFRLIQSIVSAVFGVIVAIFSGAFKIISGIVKVFAALFSGNWRALGNAIKQITQGFVQVITGLFLGAFRIIRAALTAFFSTIRVVFTSGLGFIRGLVETTWNLIKLVFTTAMTVIKTAVKLWWQLIKLEFQLAVTALKLLVQGLWNAIKLIFTTAFTIIKVLVTAFLNTIKFLFTTLLINPLKAIVGLIINVLKTGFTTAFNAVITVVRGFPGAIKRALGNVGSLLVSAGRAIIGGLLNGIKAAFNAVGDFFRGLPGYFIRLLSGAGTWIFRAGVELIQGFINGIKSMAGKVADAVRSVMDVANGIVKRVMGINSPSTVYANFGTNLMQGLIQGIEGMKRDVAKTISGLASDVLITPTLGGLNGSVARSLAGTGAGVGFGASGSSAASSGASPGRVVNITNINPRPISTDEQVVSSIRQLEVLYG